MSKEFAISFRGVTKQYRVSPLASAGLKNVILRWPRYLKAWNSDLFCALDDVSFEIAQGECFGIIGRNGSGKSTTLGLIAGVLRPTEGRIAVRGRIASLLELGAGFHPELSGKENIILNGILLGLEREQVSAKLDDIIAFSGLGEFVHRPLRVFSSGMVARLGFSVAVHLDPEVLLIDEVLAVGDEDFQRKCLRKMEEFRSRGVTMVFVSHNLNDVEAICDRAALLDSARLIGVGDPREIVAEYRRRLPKK